MAFISISRTVGCRVVVVVLFSISVEAQSKELRLFSMTNASGISSEWAVPEGRLCSTKAWSPETEAPPLTITSAVQAAIKARAPKKRWIVAGVSMNAAVCGDKFHWWYAVDMYDQGDTLANIPPDTVQQVVLMDGSIVTPRPTKR